MMDMKRSRMTYFRCVVNCNFMNNSHIIHDYFEEVDLSYVCKSDSILQIGREIIAYLALPETMLIKPRNTYPFIFKLSFKLQFNVKKL